MKNCVKSLMLFLMFFVATSSVMAQNYTDPATASELLQQKATEVSQSIAQLPPSTLEYKYGAMEADLYKRIYESIMDGKSVADAVDYGFALTGERADNHYTARAYFAANNITTQGQALQSDVFQPLRNEVDELLSE